MKKTDRRLLPSQEYLQECFEYNPDTGKVYWRYRPLKHFNTLRGYKTTNHRLAGKEVGCPNKEGYLVVGLGGTTRRLHRIIWKLVYGTEPELVDHKNRITNDNALVNLRNVNDGSSVKNRGKAKSNTSGYKGVSYHKVTGKWGATIGCDGNQTYIGLFNCPTAAYVAYCKWAIELHGEFANLGI